MLAEDYSFWSVMIYLFLQLNVCFMLIIRAIKPEMALKCIISRGCLLSLLGEDEESQPGGCSLDRGWSLLSWGCRAGQRNVPKAADREQRVMDVPGGGSWLIASEEGPIKHDP